MTANVDGFSLSSSGAISGAVINSGTINATSDAFRVDGGTMSGGIVNRGAITGGVNAFNFTSLTAPITITNTGTIAGTSILDTATLNLDGGRVTGAVSGGVNSSVAVRPVAHAAAASTEKCKR